MFIALIYILIYDEQKYHLYQLFIFFEMKINHFLKSCNLDPSLIYLHINAILIKSTQKEKDIIIRFEGGIQGFFYLVILCIKSSCFLETLLMLIIITFQIKFCSIPPFNLLIDQIRRPNMKYLPMSWRQLSLDIVL